MGEGERGEGVGEGERGGGVGEGERGEGVEEGERGGGVGEGERGEGSIAKHAGLALKLPPARGVYHYFFLSIQILLNH